MPIYEYRCEACHKPFEKLRPMRESEQPTDCPVCGNVVRKKELSVCATSVSGGASESMGGGCAPGGCGASYCRR